MTESNSQDGSRIEVWARDHAPYGASNVQTAVCDRLQRLKDEGTIGEISLHSWGGRIDSTSTNERDGFDVPEREVIAEFTTWASERGYSLRPAFETREIGLLIAEEAREVIVPPIICLAVYDDDELRGVFPHSDGGTVHTVNDCLDRLEAADGRLVADTPAVGPG